MQYRQFGKHGFEASIIGLGTMRLPLLEGGAQTDIDEKQAIELIRKAIDLGVNYIDTAYVYHGGKSEVVLGKALLDGYREKVTLADKNPVWLAETYEDFEKYFNIQLERLQTDTIDVYLLHALDLKSWRRIKALGVLRFLDDMLEKGKIKVAGFSFHDKHDAFIEIVESYNWGMTLLQMNYMDEFEQATLKGLEYAGQLGIPVVVMEPLKGGLLASAPADVAEIMADRQPEWSPVEWSFRWLAQRPEVNVILSGMSAKEQLLENVHIGKDLKEQPLKPDDFKSIELIRETYQSRIKVTCTQCQYCMPCPVGVDIPKNFKLYNTGSVYDNWKEVSNTYQNSMKPETKASACVSCHKCEEHCPQHIKISKALKEADHYLREQSL